MIALLAGLLLFAPYPRELSVGRRAVLVIVSLAGFLACVFFVGRKIRRAFEARDAQERQYPDRLP